MTQVARLSNEQSDTPENYKLLGIPISVVDMDSATRLMASWAEGKRFRSVFVREVASLMAAVKEPKLANLHNVADLVVPDGTPLVWCGRARGHGNDIGRVAGADLVDRVCQISMSTGQSHYFYGGSPGVAEEMARRLKVRFPELKVAGIYSPPFRDIGPDFVPDVATSAEIEEIRRSNADYIWVGLSSPKQEYWMMQAGPIVGRGVFIGVGAAFDFHAGTVRRRRDISGKTDWNGHIAFIVSQGGSGADT